jgi:hypothetical protein
VLGIPAAFGTKRVAENLELISRHVPPELLPVDKTALGCGHYGCVYATGVSDIVMKVTSDVSEAQFVIAAKQIEKRERYWPDGLVKYYQLVASPTLYKGKPILFLWRQAAENVGLRSLPGKPGIFTHREVVQFSYRLAAFNVLGGAVRDATKRGPIDPRRWEEGQDWAMENLDVWEWVKVNQTIIMKTKQLPARQRPGAAFWLCNQIAQIIASEAIAYKVGEALGYYLEHGIVLADVHMGNVGEVDGAVTIVDPGHAVFVGS